MYARWRLLKGWLYIFLAAAVLFFWVWLLEQITPAAEAPPPAQATLSEEILHPQGPNQVVAGIEAKESAPQGEPSLLPPTSEPTGDGERQPEKEMPAEAIANPIISPTGSGTRAQTPVADSPEDPSQAGPIENVNVQAQEKTIAKVGDETKSPQVDTKDERETILPQQDHLEERVSNETRPQTPISDTAIPSEPANALPADSAEVLEATPSDLPVTVPEGVDPGEELCSPFQYPNASQDWQRARWDEVTLFLTWSVPKGESFRALATGKVVKISESPFTGKTLYQQSADGRYCFVFGNLDKLGEDVVEGAELNCGQIVAALKSGYCQFQVRVLEPGEAWWQGEAVNPTALLKEIEQKLPLSKRVKF